MSFKETIIKTGSNILLGAKEKSPEICLIAGGIGVLATIFLACKATLELDEILTKKEDDIKRIEASVVDEEIPEYTPDKAEKDKQKVQANTIIDVAKAYAPAAGLLVISATLIIFSHKILRDRNTTLMAAYSSLATAFAAYRARVREYDGNEQDMKYLYGDRAPKMIEEKQINPETGAEEIVLVEKSGDRFLLGSPYARIFSPNYTSEALSAKQDPHNDLNFTRLKKAQMYFNDRLNMRGHVFLNEVLTHLGYPPVPEGQLVGWKKDSKVGDGYIDFRMDQCYTNPDCRDIVNPDDFRREIVLDFNVDGIIYDKIGTGLKNEMTDEDWWALQNK